MHFLTLTELKMTHIKKNINFNGVRQSNELARGWWTKAAAQGDENAIEYLQKLDAVEGKTKTTTSTTSTTQKNKNTLNNTSPTRVRLINLKTTAMNGKCGTRFEWIEEKGRFAVHLDSGRIIRVKPENLEIIVASSSC